MRRESLQQRKTELKGCHFKMPRYTLHCEPENLILAARAAKYGSLKMPGDIAIVIYGDYKETFLVRRTKAGISVRIESAS